MIFKAFGVGAVLASVVAATTLVAAPSQAASIGTVEFSGELDLVETGNQTTFDNFRNFSDVEATGILAGFLPTAVKDLLLEQIGVTNNYRVTSVPDDWKVYQSGSDTIVFDLNPEVIWTRFVDALGGISYQNGPGYIGTYTRLSDGAQFRGAGFLNLSASEGLTIAEFEISQEAAPIPTPALLPGLVGLGAIALRRRKAEAKAEVEA